MTIFSIISMLGGLAFFLFGMHIMSGNLEKVAGGKLESILKQLTSNPLKSLVLGAAITVAIQSSSALTVMLVGLVNSGIMELAQTVGVLMGSNIGTTLTAWILSLSGIQTDNIFISLLKPENFSPIIGLIGVILIMAGKTSRQKNLGTIFSGFAVLMYGMQIMSDSVAPLADMPEFTHLLIAFDNPFLGVIIGAIFTGIIQSSAASVGVLQALSLTGAISYGMAIPIVMGQNIGTCVTALLTSIGVNRNAKRVSMIHVCFNVFGTVFGLIIYFFCRSILQLDFFSQAITPFAIAAFHSIFNVVTTFLLLPFSNRLVQFAEYLIPTSEEESEKVLLDERLLVSPGLAVQQSYEKTSDMADLAYKTFETALSLFDNFSEETLQKVRDMEDCLDYYEDVLNSYLIQLSSRDLTSHDNNAISEMMHCITDFERIGDHSIGIAKIAVTLQEKNLHFSKAARKELNVLNQAVLNILSSTVENFREQDLEAMASIEPLEHVIDRLTKKIRERHIERLRSGECDGELGIVLTDYLTNCSRVSDHCSNVAACAIQSQNSAYDVHEYLNSIRDQDDSSFAEEYEQFKAQYRLKEYSSHIPMEEETEAKKKKKKKKDKKIKKEKSEKKLKKKSDKKKKEKKKDKK